MGTPLKVLMIEDSANDAELIVRELQHGGFEPAFSRVDTAADLAAAVESGQWDIILCDYALPGFNGLEAFKIVREYGKDVPFIFVSGSIGEGTVVAAIKTGVNDYIMKNNLRRLAPAVARELREAQIRREKQLAEELLKRSEERFRTLAENARDLIYRYNMRPEPAFEYVSPSALSITGYTPEEFYTDPGLLERILHEDDREDFEKPRQSDEECRPVVFRLIKKDGNTVWLEQQCTVVHSTVDGSIIAIECIARNVTERVMAEAALRVSEEKYRTLVENLPVGVSINTLGGSPVEFNRVLMEMHGYNSVSEFASLPTTERYADPEDRRWFLACVESGTARNFEVKHRRRDGSVFWVSQTAVTRTGENGEKQVLVICQDIDERKKAEADLHRHYESELKLRKAFEVEIQRRADYTRALVHELKTPLTPMLATSELMVNNMAEEPWARMARNINRSANNLNNRIEELLDLARGEIGILKLNSQPLDVRQMLVDLTNEVTPETLLFEQSLYLEINDDLPPIVADEVRLRQVMLNLINNACKYNPGKGAITISAERDWDNIIFRVRDTGRGISEAEQAHLFEPYAFLENNRVRHSGLGLGLSLSRTIIELHNGKIWVESNPGQGSIFSFSIPIIPVSPGFFDTASKAGVTVMPRE